MNTNTYRIEDFIVSRNMKTGVSINVHGCKPTPWCAAHCYGKRRTKEEGAGANNGPITWDRAQEAYKRNTAIIKWAAEDGKMDELAGYVAEEFEKAKGVYGADLQLRGNGVGDLFPELCWLYALLCAKGVPIFMFSRIPDMIRVLRRCCLALEVAPDRKPNVIGSVDSTTIPRVVEELAEATSHMIPGTGPHLAFSVEDTEEDIGALNHHLAKSKWIDIVFGYHTNHKLTRLSDKYPYLKGLECPATAGEDIKCTTCKRCYHPLA